TSPSIVPAPPSAVAFQANTGNLWITSAGTGQDLGLAMMAGTSPRITGLLARGWGVALQGSNSKLWDHTCRGISQDLDLGMMPGTSPSITSLLFRNLHGALLAHGWIVAFQANTGNLWIRTSGGISQDLELGMMEETSPSITHWPPDQWMVAFQAN